MATVGRQLHDAREGQGLTIYQVAEATKIKTEHIRALEEGNYDLFPAPVYIRGFVRNYARLLKLDLPQVMAVLDAELAQTDKFKEPPSLTGEPKGWIDFVMLQLSRINWQRALPVLVAAMVIGAVFIAVIGFRKSRPAKDPLVRLGPGLYQSSSNQTGELLPLTNPPSHGR